MALKTVEGSSVAFATTLGVVGRADERIEAIDMLSLDPKRFTTRCQNMDLWRRFDDGCSQTRHRFN